MELLFENRSAHQIETKLSDYCDVHDLLGVVSIQTQKVLAYRINGQVAFTVDRKDLDCTVSALKFKPDGSLLAVGWSDGTCGVYSGEDGKLLSQVDHNDEDEKNGVSCIGWTSHLSGPNQHAQISGQVEGELSTENWYDGSCPISVTLSPPDAAIFLHSCMTGSICRENDQSAAASISQLTRSISTIDVTNVLPRLSALPTHLLRSRAYEQKYTTQAGIGQF